MTTTALRVRSEYLPRERDVMRASFEIAKRGQGEALPAEDARRVCAMRRLARTRLCHCGLAAMSDDVVLVVSELVTNAIVHSHGTQITLVIQLKGGSLRITVHDEMPGRAMIRRPDGDAENGRGLHLVEWITAVYDGRWGTSDDGATTWCDLSVECLASQASAVDRAAMRANTALLLTPDAEVPTGEGLKNLTLQLRDSIQVLIPEVERAVLGMPRRDVTRSCAMACCGEARIRLQPRGTACDPARQAIRLARSVNALLDHLENLDVQQRPSAAHPPCP